MAPSILADLIANVYRDIFSVCQADGPPVSLKFRGE